MRSMTGSVKGFSGPMYPSLLVPLLFHAPRSQTRGVTLVAAQSRTYRISRAIPVCPLRVRISGPVAASVTSPSIEVTVWAPTHFLRINTFPGQPFLKDRKVVYCESGGIRGSILVQKKNWWGALCVQHVEHRVRIFLKVSSF